MGEFGIKGHREHAAVQTVEICLTLRKLDKFLLMHRAEVVVIPEKDDPVALKVREGHFFERVVAGVVALGREIGRLPLDES